MKKNLSPRDWELLSAYIDGQLSNGKRVQLEARLDVNPDLRAALDDLTRTRAMLRSLPRLKAPRSFRITPEMVGQREPRRLYPFFQLASAISSVMLILVLLTDFLGFRFQAPIGRMASQAPEPTIEAEVLLESAPPGITAEDLPEARKTIPERAPLPAVPGEEAPREGLMAPDALIEEEPAAEPEALMAVPAPAEGTPELEAGGANTLAAPVVPQEPPAELPEAAFEEVEPQADSFIVEADRVPENGLTSMRILQISLAVVAVSMAFIALYLRRISG
jgi:hypothetical protein